MLNQNIQQYYQLKEQADKIKAQLDILKEEIVRDMSLENKTKYATSEGITATLTSKISFDYTDEPGIINWLEKNGFESYVVKQVDTKSLNKQLKTSNTLNEGLGSMCTKKTSVSLSVSKAE